MKTPSIIEAIRNDAISILTETVTDEYAEYLYAFIEDDVVEEMFLTSGLAEDAGEDGYTLADVKLSIGRVLINRFGGIV